MTSEKIISLVLFMLMIFLFFLYKNKKKKLEKCSCKNYRLDRFTPSPQPQSKTNVNDCRQAVANREPNLDDDFLTAILLGKVIVIKKDGECYRNNDHCFVSDHCESSNHGSYDCGGSDSGSCGGGD